MVSKQLSICLILLGITLVSVVNSQRITVPLKRINDGSLFFTVKYGSDNCEVDLRPDINSCSNIITERNEIPNHCGSKYVGENNTVFGKIFVAPFKLGDIETQLLYTVPNDNSSQRGRFTLCFSINTYDLSGNALEELQMEKQITSKAIYFYLHDINSSKNNKKDEAAVVGTLTIGEPIPSLSKSQFIPLRKADNTFDLYSSVSTTYFTFGRQIAGPNVVYINHINDYITMPEDSFNDLIKNIIQRGISIRNVEEDYFVYTYLDSIDKLEPLQFTLIQEDGVSTFDVSFTPSQYTKQQADGSFELMIYSLYYQAPITIGEIILQSYNLGFDSANKRILLAEKAESQNHSLRGTHIKL